MSEGVVRTLVVKEPDQMQLRMAEQRLAAAEGLEILVPEHAELVADELREIKALAKRIEDQRKAIKQPLLEAGREVDALFKPALDFLAQAEKVLKGKLGEYQAEQRRLAQIEQERMAAEANERRKLLEEAAEIAAQPGGEWAGEILREEASQPIAAPVVQAAAMPEGTGTRETWSAEVVDEWAFMAWVLAERQMELVTINMPELNRMARAMKERLDIPGVKAVKTETVVVR